MRAQITPPLVALLMAACARPVAAQEPLTEVLSFLLTNRSVATGDFSGDAEAAAAARDALASLIKAELTAGPINSSASGFTYRLDPELGIDVRASESFGPFFVDRSLTAGYGQASFGFGHTTASFRNVDGRDLRDGTLVATASQFRDDPAPFDAETLALRLTGRTLTVSGLVGVTDRLDLSAAVPFVTVRMEGERVDTYRGLAFTQAEAVASASGIGDVKVRVKYNAIREGASGLAVAGEARLPTGDADNLLGSGDLILTPQLIGSLEAERVGVHANVGYSIGGPSPAIDFAGAVTVVGNRYLTIVGEVMGRRVEEGGRLIDVTAPHPDLAGVETIRLSAGPEGTLRMSVAAGVRWNVAERLLVNANLVAPITTTGLNARWVPSVTVDYFLGR